MYVFLRTNLVLIRNNGLASYVELKMIQHFLPTKKSEGDNILKQFNITNISNNVNFCCCDLLKNSSWMSLDAR